MMGPEDLTLSEINQTKTNTVFSLVCGISLKNELINTEDGFVTAGGGACKRGKVCQKHKFPDM